MPGAGRVIAGRARGTRLVGAGSVTRPLGDRVKQALFATLEPDLPGARVLDLFAGSGAGGVEALSRGALSAVFVERDQAAIRALEENLVRTDLVAGARVVRADAERYLAAGSGDGPFDIVLIDPPYGRPELLAAALDRLGDPASAMLAPRARVVAKHFWRERPPARCGLLASERERRFGETAITFYRATPASPGLEAG